MKQAGLLLPLAVAALLLNVLTPPAAAAEDGQQAAAAAADPAHWRRAPKWCVWPNDRYTGNSRRFGAPCHVNCKSTAYYRKRCRPAGTCQGLPPPVANGRWPESCRGATTSSSCTASCISPFFGAPVSTCQANGAWSAPAGRCLSLGGNDDWSPVSPVPAGSGVPGKIVFVNNCKDSSIGMPVYVWFQSGGNGTTTALTRVAPGSAVAKDLRLAETPAGGWRFTMFPAPFEAAGVGCPNCDVWIDRGDASDCTDTGRNCTDAVGAKTWCPRTTGSMWLANGNSSRAKAIAYCSPINSARAGINPRCPASASATPCCGPQSVFAGLMTGSYGSLFELSRVNISEPNGAWGCGYNDFVDISTNYGKQPDQPPLNDNPNSDGIPGCGTGTDIQVSRNANVYFSIPYDISTNPVSDESFSNTVQTCTLGNTQKKHSWSCRKADCADAYQDPTDKKQWVCASGCNSALYQFNRWFTVRLCPKDAATNVYEL